MLGAAWARALDSVRLDQNVPNWWPAVQKGKLKSKGKIVGGEHQGQQRRVLRDAEVGALLAWLSNMHELAATPYRCIFGPALEAPRSCRCGQST